MLDLRLADSSDPYFNVLSFQESDIPVLIFSSLESPYLIRRTLQAAEGCDLTLISLPGEGTTVELSWRADGPGASHPEIDDVLVPSEYELVGIGRIFCPVTRSWPGWSSLA